MYNLNKEEERDIKQRLLLIEERMPNDLLDKGIFLGKYLNSFQEVAWDKESALEVIDYLTSINCAIVGWDVFYVHNNNLALCVDLLWSVDEKTEIQDGEKLSEFHERMKAELLAQNKRSSIRYEDYELLYRLVWYDL